jgi:L-lactate dehydrogenase
VKDVTVSLPHLVGGEGILDTFPLALNEEEQALLGRSAAVVGDAIRSLER